MVRLRHQAAKLAEVADMVKEVPASPKSASMTASQAQSARKSQELALPPIVTREVTM